MSTMNHKVLVIWAVLMAAFFATMGVLGFQALSHTFNTVSLAIR